MNLQPDCAAEVEDLHRFLAAWMTGALAKTESAFARFRDVLDENFVIISPRGAVTRREALSDELWAAHGVHRDAAKNFRIWIENCRCRVSEGGLCLVTYEEWQQLSGAVTGRMSTALFAPRPGAPRCVVWRHLHETWLPESGPPA